MEHAIEVVLSTFLVLVPPLTQCGHVVGRDGTYRTVGVTRQMAEAYGVILRHRLDLQREDAQLVHHPGHTVGYHTQVFRTAEHAGSLCQTRQLLHGLLVPELIVTTVEVVVVQAVEVILLAIVQSLVWLLILHGNTWMPTVTTLVVNKE